MVDFDFILACVIVVRPLMGDAILHMTLNQFQIAVLTILMNHQCEILNKLKVRIHNFSDSKPGAREQCSVLKSLI